MFSIRLDFFVVVGAARPSTAGKGIAHGQKATRAEGEPPGLARRPGELMKIDEELRNSSISSPRRGNIIIKTNEPDEISIAAAVAVADRAELFIYRRSKTNQVICLSSCLSSPFSPSSSAAPPGSAGCAAGLGEATQANVCAR